ncbi:MAG TPA: hypothetical protein VLY63_24540 [Anaerolineae bacterium]|nr:hypothetical protein [Anaerolineae bacterium]
MALISPGLAVSVQGRARVVREQMDHDVAFAILEIDVDEVKNDMVYRINIDCGIEITSRDKYKSWYNAAMAELEALD